MLAELRQLAAEQEHQAARAQILEGMRFWCWLDATPQEQQQARAAVGAAMTRFQSAAPMPRC